MVQIVARAYRQPQKKSVRAIHLLADGSSDVLLNSIALRKREMFDAFVSKERGQGKV
jgi:SNF2 family DNA or RNA helicase